MAEHRRVDVFSVVMSLWVYLSLISLVIAQDMNQGGFVQDQGGVGMNNRFDNNPKFNMNNRANDQNNQFGGEQQAQNHPPKNLNLLQNAINNAALPNRVPPKVNIMNNPAFNAPQVNPQQGQNFGNQPPRPDGIRKNPTIKLSEHPDCEKDVKMFCASSTNNFAVLDCLQNDLKSDQDVSEACQHIVWGYKKNLTTDLRFDAAAKEVCKDELTKFPACSGMTAGQGQMIPCLIEFKGNVTTASCKTFLNKMASIVFSDYRLIYKFAESCNDDIIKKDCGRLHKENDDSPHSQGRTVECLSKDVKTLDDKCKHEILRIAELQADDYHLDRPLFYACREDRERLCQRTRAGSGKVYKCLTRHKFERDMSSDCREKLTQRQRLTQSNYKVNKGLAQSCQRDIMENKCIQDTDPGFKHARLSKVVLCLEQVMKEHGNVEADCVIELKEVRQSLMEDYQISPEIVANCADDIKESCDGVHREGKTLHCLMDLARPKIMKNHRDHIKLQDVCLRELEKLIKEADVGDDWTIDPALKQACDPIAQVHCKDIKGGEGRVMNCLMEHIDSDTMSAECEERLLEIHYFLARDFSLDPRLYKYCHGDATNKCGANEQWHQPDNMNPDQGPLTFACLYRHLKLYPKNSDHQLSRACSFEVRRVMRQRAISVELEPRIEEPCMADLGAFCSDNMKVKEEMRCLQDNLDDLGEDCRWAVGNFTEDEDMDPSMDKLLMKSCSPMIKTFCEDLLDKDVEPMDVMDCLIQHKNDNEMDEKCAGGIEHHQLITMKDYHFSVKFKEACKQDVMENCENVRKKAEVVECLSMKVRDAILKDQSHDVSRKCRKQLSFELLQRGENIELDPKLKLNCELDIPKYCKNVTPGNANVIECLKKHQKALSINCHELLFDREKVEAEDVSADYLLMHSCKKMIKRYCMDESPSDIFDCLLKRKREEDFDHKCSKVILERQRQRSKDIQLNPTLMAACNRDILKFCPDQMTNAKHSKTEVEGKVTQCLKARFAQRHALTDGCRDHVKSLISEAALDYQQDPQLMAACKNEIDEMCTESLAGDSADPDGGRVIECLKDNLASQKITLIKNSQCIKEVARVLAEDQADIQVDPLLYKECVLDIKHYCFGIPRGEGRQMSCLLAALDDKKVQLRPRCQKMLQDRVNMWELAAKVAPPNTFQELIQQVTTSDSRNYFMGVLFAVIGMIFIGGLMCGRVTKRMRAEMKNR